MKVYIVYRDAESRTDLDNIWAIYLSEKRAKKIVKEEQANSKYDTWSYKTFDVNYTQEELDNFIIKHNSIPGKPKYKEGDKVQFLLDNKLQKGKVGIVDAYGIFGDNSQPYYDIWVIMGDEKVLVKHIKEKSLKEIDTK